MSAHVAMRMANPKRFLHCVSIADAPQPSSLAAGRAGDWAGSRLLRADNGVWSAPFAPAGPRPACPRPRCPFACTMTDTAGFPDPSKQAFVTDTLQHAWLDKANVLIEALPFMRRYAGQTVVIKYGGNAMGNVETGRHFARDVVLLKQVGINPVVVHGGGPQIGRVLGDLNIQSHFVDGLRVTGEQEIDVVEMVLAGSVNKSIVAAIQQVGGRAIGLSGKDGGLIRARKLTRTTRDPESNIEKVVDLGFVGEPEAIDPEVLQALAATDFIPVIAPTGMGTDGRTYNINADTVAGAIAGALKATRLFLLTDVPGVMTPSRDLIAELRPGEARQMIADGRISGGMIPKIETCLRAVEEGVGGAVILDGRTPHILLLEAFTGGGAGTLIRPLAQEF